MNSLKSHELKLLILTLIIFFLSIFSWANDPMPPKEPNQTKMYLQEFFQPGIGKNALYSDDMVDSGQQGIITRRQLEDGAVAVFRYGNPRSKGGIFPASIWASNEIQRTISEYIEDGLSAEDARTITGYSFGEQKIYFEKVVEEKEKYLGRRLTDNEKNILRASIEKTYPTQVDPQVDETEGIAVVSNRSILDIYRIFSQRNQYSSLLADHFLYSYILTAPELEKRKIVTGPHQDFIFARFYIAGMTVEYTDFNDSTLEFIPVILKKREGTVSTKIPQITTAWRIDPRFINDGRFMPELDPKTGRIIGGNGKYGHKDIMVIDGYIEISPYIAKDHQGFEWIDDNKTMVVYHTYLKIDPNYKDTTGFPPSFRESHSRKFMEKMMSIIQK